MASDAEDSDGTNDLLNNEMESLHTSLIIKEEKENNETPRFVCDSQHEIIQDKDVESEIPYYEIIYNLEHCTEQMPNSYKCGFCGCSFKTKELMEKHLVFHKLFACNKCNFSVDKMADLRNHLYRVHRKKSNKSTKGMAGRLPQASIAKIQEFVMLSQGGEVDNGAQKLPCPTAPTSTKDVDVAIVKHKSYKCLMCSYKSQDRSEVQKHMAVHEKNFECDLCDKKFFKQCNLDLHVRCVHNGEIPFCCSNCKFKCMKLSELAKHMDFHKGECCKCDLCNLGFKSMNDLSEHTRVKHIEYVHLAIVAEEHD